MNIYIAGSERSVPKNQIEEFRTFLHHLGSIITKSGHHIYTGCSNSVDRMVAEGAHEWLMAENKNPADWITSYKQRRTTPSHQIGIVRLSELPDWSMAHAELTVPEQIDHAHVAIFIGGGEGTYIARNWAHWSRKPIIGIPHFGGAGSQIYKERLKLLNHDKHDSSSAMLYEEINRECCDPAEHARKIIHVAERLLIPRVVFPIYSFHSKWKEVHSAFTKAGKRNKFSVTRTDEGFSMERINARIESGIYTSAFVMVDISEPSPNVFFELGLAKGCGKPMIVTAKEQTQLPFDLADISVIFWKDEAELIRLLDHKIDELTEFLAKTGVNLREAN